MHVIVVLAVMYRIAIVSLATNPAPVNVHVDFANAAAPAVAASSIPLAPRRSAAPLESAPQHGREGDHRTFWVQYIDPTHPSSARWASVNATLEFSTEHTDLWEDDDIDGLMTARFEQMSKEAESGYASQHGRFGSLSYTEADRRRHMVSTGCKSGQRASVPAFAPSRGELLTILVVDPAKTKTGYTSIESYYSAAALECSSVAHTNELPGLIVLPVLDPTSDPRSTMLELGPAHELQHLKNFVRHAILGSGPMRSSTINEGLSVLAQDFEAENARNRRDADGAGLLAHDYLYDPNTVSLFGFFYHSGDEVHPSGSACYGGAYLLQRYFYDRFGDAYLERVTDTSADGLVAVAGALPIAMPDALRDFAGYVLQQKRRDDVRPLPGADFKILGGSLSLFESATPVGAVNAPGANIVWTQVER